MTDWHPPPPHRRWEDMREEIERWLERRPALKWEYERRYHVNPFDAYVWALGKMRRP